MTSGEPSIAQRITLEQQNHKRLLIASQEQDSISGPHQQGQGQFPPAVSPFGTRSGLSPNPKETKSRKPKLGHQEQPGSPMPDSIMQQQRGSPAPNMNFTDPILAPPGALPFYQHLPPDMKPPPISYPIANFGGQQPTPQQVEAMRNGQKNGQRRGVPPQPGMSLQMMQEMLLQRKEMAREVNPMMQHQTPAHPAPARRRGHNRSHGPSNQALPKPNPAPPTPDQTSETAPRNKGTKGKKVHLRAPPSSPSSADADPRSPQKATPATPARQNAASSRPFPGTIPAGTTSNYDPDSWPCRRDMASSHVMSECFRNAPVEVPSISKTNKMEEPGSSSPPRRLGRHCQVHSHERLQAGTPRVFCAPQRIMYRCYVYLAIRLRQQ
jgi:hypothetical protein